MNWYPTSALLRLLYINWKDDNDIYFILYILAGSFPVIENRDFRHYERLRIDWKSFCIFFLQKVLILISVQNGANTNSIEAQGFGLERDRKQEI